MIFLGCHVVAPSDMNDGRIKAIKQKLLENSLDTKVFHQTRFTDFDLAYSHSVASILQHIM